MLGNTFNPSGGGPFYLSFGVFTSINPFAAAASPYLTAIDRPLNLIKWTQVYQCLGLNNAANYWTLRLLALNTGSVHATLDTLAYIGGWENMQLTTFAIPSIAYPAELGMYLNLTPIGAPGNLRISAPLLLVS